MKKVSFIAALVAASLVFCACNYSNKDLLKARIENMEKYSGNPGSAENIEEGIKQYDGEAQELIKKYDKIGIWYKILGTRYMDKKMWDKALDAFTNASKIYPENPIIYYYAAVCAGYMANNPLVKASEKMEYLKLSEQCYIASNKIDDRNTGVLYGLGVLYTNFLDEPEKAVPYFEKLLSIEKRHYDGMFRLGEAYYLIGNYSKAIEQYDNIIDNCKSDDMVKLAKQNKKICLDIQFED